MIFGLFTQMRDGTFAVQTFYMNLANVSMK